MSRNDWVKARCIWESVKMLSKLINPNPGFDKFSVKIGVPIFIISEPSERCWMVISIVICPETIPVRRDLERLDEVGFFRDFFKILSRKDLPVAVAIRLSQRFVGFRLKSVDIVRVILEEGVVVVHKSLDEGIISRSFKLVESSFDEQPLQPAMTDPPRVASKHRSRMNPAMGRTIRTQEFSEHGFSPLARLVNR